MDTVTLARAFFGSSLAFHIIFATLGVGLSLMIFISEILYHWKKDSDYAIMAKKMDKGLCHPSWCSNSNWNNRWCANLTALAGFCQNCWAGYFCSLSN